MAVFDGVQQPPWGENPIFPKATGKWIPLVLFSVSSRLEVKPEVALGVLSSIATALEINIHPGADLVSIFTLKTEEQIETASQVVMQKLASLESRLDLNVSSSLTLSDNSSDLDLAVDLGITAGVDISLLRKLAVEQGLLVESGGTLTYVGVQSVGTQLNTASAASMVSVKSLKPSMSLVSSMSASLMSMMRLNAQLSLAVNTSCSLEVIKSVPVFGILKSGTQAGAGTGWLSVSNQYADPSLGAWTVSPSGPATIPAQYGTYDAYIYAECYHTGGNSPRYGQTRLSIDGYVVEGTQVSASPGTSVVSTTITLHGGSTIYWNWRGEGNFFNRPTLQPSGTKLTVTPY